MCKYLSLYPQVSKYSPHPLSRRSFIDENHNQSKCRVVKPSPNGDIYKTLCTEGLGKHCRRWGQKDCKSQRIREFAVGSSLLVMSESTSIHCHQHDNMTVQMWAEKGWRQWTCPREKLRRLQPYTKNSNPQRRPGVWEVFLPREKPTNQLSSFSWSAQKTCIPITLHELRRFYL